MLELLPLDPKNDGVSATHRPPAPEPVLAPRADTLPALKLLNADAIEVEHPSAPKAENPPATEPPGPERFLAIAAAEFERGNVDQMLWDRAMVQAKDDRDAAIAIYLRARATILQVLDRDKRVVKHSRSSAARDRARHGAANSGIDDNKGATSVVSRLSKVSPRRAVAVVIACIGLVACAAVFVNFHGNSSATATTAATNPASAKSAQALAQDDGAKRMVKAADNDAAKKALLELAAKVEALRDAGNWNVHVLYAAEWTRKDPGNAAAWNELGIGYEKLRQFDDAYAAASKAVAYAPTNGMYWRNLGLLDVQINLPEEALRAFTEAAAANDQDTLSMVQVGLLNARLGRIAEAKAALERAQAANIDDANTTCLKTLIARRQTAPKATAAAGKPLEPLDGACGERAEVPVVASSSKVPVKGPVRTKR